MKNKISIVVVGSSHRDHSPLVMLQKMMRRLLAQNLAVRYCVELEEDQTIKMKKLRDEQCHLGNVELFTVPAIKGLLRKEKSCSKPFFKFSDKENIKVQIRKASSLATNSQLENGAVNLISYLAYQQKNKLNDFVIANNIPFQGLEYPMEKRNKEFVEPINNSNMTEEDFKNKEQGRIDHMVGNIFGKIMPSLKDTGGIIICDVGTLHAHRLAANVMFEASKKKLDVELNIIPIQCYSNYSIDSMATNLNFIKEMKEQDPEEIKEIYTEMKANQVELYESKDGSSFTSKEFCSLFNKASAFVKPPKTFFIPSGNPKVREVIAKINGKIVAEKEQGMRVSLCSDVLLKSVREQLGLDRKLLTLTDAPTKQVEYLKSFKVITVEKTCYRNGYIVTFPKDQLENVTRVVNQWDDIAKQIKKDGVEEFHPELKSGKK